MKTTFNKKNYFLERLSKKIKRKASDGKKKL
jgi:hypothetical protein